MEEGLGWGSGGGGLCLGWEGDQLVAWAEVGC